MRHTRGSAKGAYVGVSVGVYFEAGESPGRAAGVSINLLPDMLSARPKLAQLVRF